MEVQDKANMATESWRNDFVSVPHEYCTSFTPHGGIKGSYFEIA